MRAPTLGPSPGSGLTPARAALGALVIALGGIVGSTPAEDTLTYAAGLALVLAMLTAPIVGLYAALAMIPFSPTFALAGAEFSLSAVEPLVFLTVAIWLAGAAIGRTVEVPRNGQLGALFFLLCTLLIAAGGATSVPLAIKESLKWLLLALAYLFTSVHVRDEKRMRQLLAVIFAVGSAEALFGILQFVMGWGPPTFAIGGFIRSHGHFGQPNPFAGYLGTIFPLALALATLPEPRRFRWVAQATAVCTGLAIALSLSRGAWLGLTIALALMALAWGPRTRRLVPPTVVLLVLIGLLGVLGLLPGAIATRVTSITNNFGIFDARGVLPSSETHAVVERMAHWQAGWGMFADHPLRGVGPGNYPAAYERYALPLWREPLGHAHNYYLNMAAEAGLLGLIALLLVLGVAFRAIVRSLAVRRVAADGRPSSFSRALALGLLGSLTVFCTHNVFDNLLVHGVGVQIGVLLGLAGGLPTR